MSPRFVLDKFADLIVALIIRTRDKLLRDEPGVFEALVYTANESDAFEYGSQVFSRSIVPFTEIVEFNLRSIPRVRRAKRDAPRRVVGVLIPRAAPRIQVEIDNRTDLSL